jgi:hypothetical protein
MILDLTLKNDEYLLHVHRRLFLNESAPVMRLQEENLLTRHYAEYGKFILEPPGLGLDACFRLITGDKDCFIYHFPISQDYALVRKMMLSVHILMNYPLDMMHYHQEFFQESMWDDQSFSVVIGNGENRGTDNYGLSGKLFPWFKAKLESLTRKDIRALNDYVKSELNRFHILRHGKEIYFSQTTITRQSFLLVVAIQDRWVSSTNDSLACTLSRPSVWDSHNLDNGLDQELGLAAITILNTWLREH